MSRETKRQDLEEILARFDATPFEATFASRQESFETLTMLQRDGLRTHLSEEIPSLAQATYADVNTMLVVIGFGALREGARALACSVSRDPSVPASEPIDFTRLWAAALDTTRPSSELHAALVAVLDEHPEIEQLVSLSGHGMLDRLVKRFPLLSGHEEFLRRSLFSNLFHGVRAELLYPRLIAETLRERTLVERAVRKAEEGGAFSPDELAFLRARLRLSRQAGPWPKDLTCSCGADLTESLTCCDGALPIDPELLAHDLSVSFTLKTPCCGALLTGVRCRECGHYHTWTHGVVATLR